MPTFAYQFNDDSAPQRFAPPGALMPPIATHSSEIQYLFDQPNTPVPATLDADQERLAATHANGLGDVRRDRQPVDESSALAVVQRRLGGAVARVAAATARVGLRLGTPLLVLGRRMTCTPRRVPSRLVGTA